MLRGSGKIRFLVTLAVLVFVLSTMPGTSLAKQKIGTGGGKTSPDVVMEWNRATLDMIKSENIPASQFGSRLMAMVHIAMFDAVNGIQHKYHPFLVSKTLPRLISPEVRGFPLSDR